MFNPIKPHPALKKKSKYKNSKKNTGYQVYTFITTPLTEKVLVTYKDAYE